jgi:hypothetical protein
VKVEQKQLEARMHALEQWLQWCLDNCYDSADWNFGTDATNKMHALLRGEDVAGPNATPPTPETPETQEGG